MILINFLKSLRFSKDFKSFEADCEEVEIAKVYEGFQILRSCNPAEFYPIKLFPAISPRISQ